MEGTTTPKTGSSGSSTATTALRGVVAALALTSSAAFVAPTARTTGPLAARRSAGKIGPGLGEDGGQMLLGWVRL